MIGEKKKQGIRQNNGGFSLIELIVSIVLLAIVVSPLLNNFIVSMNINSEAKKVQNQNILAQSLMEEYKGKCIEEITREFNYPEDGSLSYEAKQEVTGGYTILQESEQSCIRTEGAGPTGSIYEYQFIEKMEQPYYFARKNIEYQGEKYDAMMILDGTVYQGTDPGGNPIGYNTFRMPVLQEINQNEDVVAVQSYEAELAVATLFGNHFTYCLTEEELHQDDPSFSITYHSMEEIKNKIEKIITIRINRSGSGVIAEVLQEYSCSSYPGCGSVSYEITTGTTPDLEGQIYVFYYPSYQDEVIITKDPLLTEDVAVHLYRQDTVSYSCIPETISIPAGINLYSNVSFPGIPAKPVGKAAPKNRIYRMKIRLYTAGDDFNPEALCIELESTKGE